MSLTIYYDGDCPFCARYVKLLRLRAATGKADLVNLRDVPGIRKTLESEGFDLDQGMVVETQGRRIGGADAVHALALMSTPSDFFNRLNSRLLSSQWLAALLYPMLRSGRWVTLFFLGRAGLNDEDRDNRNHMAIFSAFFALFSMFHFLNYALQYNRFPPQLDQIALFLSAVILFWKPHSSRALFLLVLTSTISTIVQAPIASNHTMVRSAALLGYWASFFYAMARGLSWGAIFANFTVSGRGALLVMYFFGIFHKINTDFLSPETSCAVALWREMPLPLRVLDFSAIHYMTIYGTFFLEGLLVVALLIPRIRHIGIVGGILFHMLLAFSSYSMYLTFTTLSIALHTLFLSKDGAARIVQSPEMTHLRNRMSRPIYLVIAVGYFATMALYVVLAKYSIATLLALPIVVPFCVMVIRYGHATELLEKDRPSRPSMVIGTVVTAMFFVNCTLPYFGLKSAQAVNMFANLRLEGGISNHLVLPNPPGPFTYLQDVAIITDPGEGELLQFFQDGDFGLIYYDMLVYLQDNPDLTVSFTVGDRAYENVSAAVLEQKIDTTLHARWFRKWFHFQPVKLTIPEPCNF